MFSVLNTVVTDLATPANISYMWGFGSLLGLCLGLQLVTGVFLAMHYSSSPLLAFEAVKNIMQDVSGGYSIRVLHANGASLMFICLYLHVGRGLYVGSYMNNMAWNSGILLVFLTMATAFLGYVLPWGQMSFWGAAVITGLISTLPYVGSDLVVWLWGGFSVGGPTLARFFALHYLLPLIIVAMAMIHLVFIHEKGASNPLGCKSVSNLVLFHPYFSYKDMIGFLVVVGGLISVCMLTPYMLGDPDNFILANSLVTPVHIQPEWYFLFAYAILRSIPSKLGGVVALVSSILVLAIMPLVGKGYMSGCRFYGLLKMVFWWLVVTFILLTWAGAQLVESPFVNLSRVLGLLYFGLFVLWWFMVSHLDWLLSRV